MKFRFMLDSVEGADERYMSRRRGRSFGPSFVFVALTKGSAHMPTTRCHQRQEMQGGGACLRSLYRKSASNEVRNSER